MSIFMPNYLKKYPNPYIIYKEKIRRRNGEIKWALEIKVYGY